MVVIAQLAEHRIVVPSVVGSSPTLHPKEKESLTGSFIVLLESVSTRYCIEILIIVQFISRSNNTPLPQLRRFGE